MAEHHPTSDNALKWFVPGLVIGLIVGMAIGAIVPPLLERAAVVPPSPGVTHSTGQPADRRVSESNQGIGITPGTGAGQPAPTQPAPTQPAPTQSAPTQPQAQPGQPKPDEKKPEEAKPAEKPVPQASVPQDATKRSDGVK